MDRKILFRFACYFMPCNEGKICYNDDNIFILLLDIHNVPIFVFPQELR
jgi:hypothetical protein